MNSFTPIISKSRAGREEEMREVTPLMSSNRPASQSAATETSKMKDIHGAIATGANAFLFAEYSICAQFVVAFFLLYLD